MTYEAGERVLVTGVGGRYQRPSRCAAVVTSAYGDHVQVAVEILAERGIRRVTVHANQVIPANHPDAIEYTESAWEPLENWLKNKQKSTK